MSATPSHIARYTVVQPIAAGGMGEVFLARDEKLDRLVAIKLLRDGFDSDELRDRFEEEARNVAKLTHPNIVTIYEYGAHEGRPYIAMEYVAGHSMAELIRRQAPLSLPRRIRLIEELCSGLGHAHKAHLVHRDVKPANLMVTTSGMLKVLDFGIAKLRGTDRTQKGLLVGTVNYMSPEQITGQPVDHRSDIFAVGAVLHEVLTYEQAFKGDLTTALYGIVHGQPEPLATRCPGLDPTFQIVVNRCLAKDPADRHQDLGLLKRELARLRRPLEEEDGDAADTLLPFDVEKTMVFGQPKPSSGAERRPIGPDTRRALGSALASGEAAIARGQFDSAVRHAEQALALEAANVSARDLLARAKQAGDSARVASALDRARNALVADKIDDARTALLRAAEVAPASDTVRGLADQVERRAVDLARLEQTIAAAKVKLAEHDIEQALQLAQTALVIRPDDSELRRLRDQIDQAAADDARRREGDAKRQAEVDRAAQMASLLVAARNTVEALPTRRTAALELLRLDPAHAAAATLVTELDETIAEAARQRELDDALAAGEALLAQGQLDAAEAKAAGVALARAGDARAGRLTNAVAAGRRKRQIASDALARAEVLASGGRWDEAIAAVQALDAREVEVATLLTRLQRERNAEWRRRRVAAIGAGARNLAANRLAQAGVGIVGVIALAVWSWTAWFGPTVTRSGGARAAAIEGAVFAGMFVELKEPARAEGTAAGSADDPAQDGMSVSDSPAWLPGEVTAIDALLRRREFDAALARIQQAQARAPRVAELSALAARARGARDKAARDDAARDEAARVTAARDEAARTGAASERSQRVATLLERARRATEPRAARRQAARDVLDLDPQNAEARRIVAELEAEVVVAGGGTGVPAVKEAPEPPRPEKPAPDVQVQSDEFRIRDLVGRFGQAYQNKDIGGMKTLWPQMGGSTESSYRNAFSSNRALAWSTSRADVQLNGSNAVAQVAAQVELRELRTNAATVEQRSYRFRFERRVDRWVIVGVDFLGSRR